MKSVVMVALLQHVEFSHLNHRLGIQKQTFFFSKSKTTCLVSKKCFYDFFLKLNLVILFYPFLSLIRVILMKCSGTRIDLTVKLLGAEVVVGRDEDWGRDLVKNDNQDIDRSLRFRYDGKMHQMQFPSPHTSNLVILLSGFKIFIELVFPLR